jgi:hypothetical protein
MQSLAKASQEVGAVSRLEIVTAELERIRLANGGLLSTEAVVAMAKEPESVLHEHFEWNNVKAGHLYRLWQARRLIQMVTMPGIDSGKEARVYLSLVPDRGADGGYRSINDILGNRDLRAQMLQQAISEFDRWQERHKNLLELVGVFESMEDVKKTARNEKLS